MQGLGGLGYLSGPNPEPNPSLDHAADARLVIKKTP